MTKKSVAEIVGTIVDELTPLSSEERLRVVHASLTLLGEAAVRTAATPRPDGTADTEEDGTSFPPRAKTWMRQNQLSEDSIAHVFHVNVDQVDIIASEIPGKNNREKVRNAYILTGIARLLASGEPKFEDKLAREQCEAYGFYDPTNHMKYMKGGNEFTGSKDKGWTLTAPGLKRGAALVAELLA